MWTHFFCQPGPFTACAPLHTSAHLCAPLHTFMHPCTPLCFTFPGLVTLIQLSSDLRPPSSYHGQPSPSATGHSAHSGPLYNQVQPLWPPCGPSAFPVGLHNPHSHSRIWSGWVTSHQKRHPFFIVVSPVTGSQTTLSHGPWVGKFFFLGKTPTCRP